MVLATVLGGRWLLDDASEREAGLQDEPADEPVEPEPQLQQPFAASSISATRPPPQKHDAGQVPVHELAPSTPPQAADDRPSADGKPLPVGASTSMRPSMIRRRRRRR